MPIATDPAHFTCIYCNSTKAVTERSLEHIWPSAFGGNNSPDWFKTRDVCRRCNNNVGLFVDAEISKSYIGTSMQMFAHLPFIDLKNPRPLPLIYMGTHKVAPSSDEVCEGWVGPRGEAIYYLRRADDRRDFDTYAAGDPIRRKRSDPGRVYFGLTKPNTFWLYAALEAIKARFPEAELRTLVSFSDVEFVKRFDPENEQSAADRRYIEPLWAKSTQNLGQVLSVHFGIRFQHKLALGFGHALFGNDFARGHYANALRNRLWRHGSAAGSAHRIVGKPFWEADDPSFTAQFSTRGAFTLLFARSQLGVCLFNIFPGGKSTSTMILPRAAMLQSKFFKDFTGQFMVLLFPAINRFVGPIPAVAYAMHRLGQHVIPELQEIEARCRSIGQIEAEAAQFDISADMAA